MSHCEEKGRHKVIFLTKEDADSRTSNISLTEEADPSSPQSGLIQPDGSINWSCPCLGGMAVGPCGVEFREAFECFHYSEADPKGSDCLEKFMTMQECLSSYPELYDEKSKSVPSENQDSNEPSQNSDSDPPAVEKERDEKKTQDDS